MKRIRAVLLGMIVALPSAHGASDVYLVTKVADGDTLMAITPDKKRIKVRQFAQDNKLGLWQFRKQKR